MDSPEIVAVAYGTTSRIVKNATEELKKEGVNMGIIRPITVWPFPYHVLNDLPQSVKHILTVEMSMGQMIEDVKLGVNGQKPVHFYGRTGGVIPDPQGIINKVKEILGGDR